MASPSYHIANLLDKMTSSDKDFRFMATNDLMAELQKDSIKLDDDSERKVVKMLLKLLEDKNGEVQNLAVKCLGPLVNKVKEFQVETIVDTLCTNMMSDKEQLRDISSIGLKTVISELPASSTTLASSICRKITGRLTSAITKQEDVSVQLESLDIMGDMLVRFGHLLLSFHPSIQQALVPQLSSPRLAVRKRSIIAIGHLVMSCNGCIFNELIDFLLHELQKNTSMSTSRTYIQCIGMISRQAGHRTGDYLDKIVPLVVKFSAVEDDELREYCLQVFESFILRMPKEIVAYIQQIVSICLKYLTYDPNYNYDDDEEEAGMDVETEDAADDDEDYSDDDDMSWKVRRAAAKCLNAVVLTRHDMLSDLYQTVSPALIARFKEREENVKADIFGAYICLLRQTKPAAVAAAVNSMECSTMENETGPVAMLQAQITSIVKAVNRQLKDKSIKTRQACFSLLSELVLVLPGCLADYLPSIVPGLAFSLSDKTSNSNMRIDTLGFLNILLTHHNPYVFHPHVTTIITLVVSAVNDSFYKITSEALVVTQQLVKVLRPLDSSSDFNFLPYVQPLYQCTLQRLKAADIDQEVKERAIACMGQIIYNLGDSLTTELPKCLPIFIERLKNEITRLTTVKALTLIAGSPLSINIQPFLPEAISVLASFLRKNHRALKLSTLACLDVIMQRHGSGFPVENVASIMKETPPLISEADLHISQLTLCLLTTICRTQQSAATAYIRGDILQQLLLLLRSPLLQGGALTATLEFVESVASLRAPSLGFNELLEMLTFPVYSPSTETQSPTLAIHKQAFHSMAKCVAIITVSHRSEWNRVVGRFIGDLKNPKSSDSIRLFSLLALGEIGRHIDLSSDGETESVILASFSQPNEDVKTAASYALGGVAVGNLPHYLPFVLNEITNQPRRQYLLLHSLKEIISCESNPLVIKAFTPYISTIWSLLMEHCECQEEGTRNVVAECLGKLTLLEPSTLLPKLQKQLHSGLSSVATGTIVTAVKFTITDQPQPIDSMLRLCIGDFLETLHDPNADLNVRRVALVTFNSAAHNKPSLIRDLLGSFLPLLYAETKVKKELIREVEMGPFKHTVDDGLDLRKAAFECMYTLLDSCLDRIDLFEFLNHVEDGLKDHYDVKMLTYLMLVRLAHLCPGPVLQRLDRLIEPLKQTCTSKVKANAVKQEYEKSDELKRSALRAVVALLKVPDADKNAHMVDFTNQIKASPELQSLFDSIQKDVHLTGNDMSSLMDVN